MEEQEGLTEQEKQELAEIMGGAATPEEKHNTHSFLTKVVEQVDTTKVGNLDEEEIGQPKFPQRVLKELNLFCDSIANMPYFASYFDKEAEIVSSTSLSKEGILIKLASVKKAEFADVTPKAKKNKGWFRRKK